MKINYQLSTSKWNKHDAALLSNYGIHVEEGSHSIVSIDEYTFLKNKAEFDTLSCHKTLGTDFTKKEINDALWLVETGLPEKGYPQPEDSYNFENFSFDCMSCKMNRTQLSPFRIKKEPKWGRGKMFNLTWVYDEIFCEKEFYELFWAKFGIGRIEVLIHKSGITAKSVVQLEIPSINHENQITCCDYEYCEGCGQKRYIPRYRGFFTQYEESLDEYHIFKTREYFGSGGQSYRHIILSQEIRQALLNNQPKQNFQVMPLGINP